MIIVQVQHPDAIYEFKSIGNSRTLPHDTTDQLEIDSLLDQLAEKVSARLRYKDVVSENIQIMIRYHDRKTVTRSRQLRDFVEKKDEVFMIAKMLFDEHWNGEPSDYWGLLHKISYQSTNIPSNWIYLHIKKKRKKKNFIKP